MSRIAAIEDVIAEHRAEQAVDVAGGDGVEHDRGPGAHHGGGGEEGDLAGEAVDHGCSE